MYNLARPLTAKVDYINEKGRWVPRPRNRITLQIIDGTPAEFLPNPQSEDQIIWIPSPTGQYTTKSTWTAIRNTE